MTFVHIVNVVIANI